MEFLSGEDRNIQMDGGDGFTTEYLTTVNFLLKKC